MAARGLTTVLVHGEGVLAEVERDGRLAAMTRALRDAGFDWDWDHVLYGKLRRAGGPREQLRHYLRHYRPCGGPRRDPGPFVEAMAAAAERAYDALLAAGAVPLRAGVERLLREAAAAGIALVLVTAGPDRIARLLLEGTLGPGGPGLFRGIVPAEDAAARPPDAGSALAIADARAGLIAAAAAGVPAVVTPSWYADRERFTEARLVISGLGEPGAPFQVLRGDPAGHRFASVDALRAWHAAWGRR